MLELLPEQIAILERLASRGFAAVAFPLYASAIGIRKGNCAALLQPVAAGGFLVYGEPSVLLDGNLSVRITREGRSWFVWKQRRTEATPELLSELKCFVSELKLLLDPASH
jgi:hypothetical protein